MFTAFWDEDFPRRAGDTPESGSVWKLGTEELNSDKYKPDEAELEKLKSLLNMELDKVNAARE